MKPLRAILPILLLVSLTATSAAGFDALRTSGGRVVHAPRTPWPVYLQADPIDKISVAKAQNVTLAAIDAWNAVADTKMRLTYGGLVRQAPHLGVYIWLDRTFQWQNTDGTARTEMQWDVDGGLREVSIALNGVDFQWITGTSTSTSDARPGADLQSVVTHQLGHALGLTHSHDSTATMYFWGTNRAGRTLTADDARSLRFVYPATDVTASTTCDPCRSDADCAGTGRCLIWPDGFAYCAAPCLSNNDCPIGTSCGTYASGVACLPNDGHCNADRATDHMGDACASDFACVDADLCMPVASGQGFCTSGCNSSFDCQTGATCAPAGYCADHGAGTDGAACRVPGDCASASCLASILRTGTCGRACSGQCGGGEVCGTDGLCRPACTSGQACPSGATCASDGVCRGPLAIGWPCSSGYDCATGSCVTVSGLRFDSVCSQSCNVPTDCPAGTGCASTAKGKLCVPGAQLTVGSPCTTNAACGSGLVCDTKLTYAGFGTCAPACSPTGAQDQCAGGWCDVIGGAITDPGVCRIGGAGQVEGQACSDSQPCRGDFVCAVGLSGPVCSRPCALDAPVCAQGLSCIALDGWNGGVCMDGGTTAQRVHPTGTTENTNPYARPVSLPQVVPVTQFKPPATPIATPSGCDARRTARSPVGVLLLLWLVLGRVRRSRLG